MKVYRFWISLLAISVLMLITGCGQSTPSVDAIETAIAKTSEAVPTDTPTPVPTPTSTSTTTNTPTLEPTSTPTSTATNTATPKPTNTSTPKPTATNTVTPEPTSTPTSKPTATNTPVPKPTSTPVPELIVEFRNPHYECQNGRIWHSDSEDKNYSGYRSFQTDFFIHNAGEIPIEPKWEPTRWIIADGVNERVSELMWQWVSRRTGFYEQPIIVPGDTQGWTYLAYPLNEGEWVSRVEYDYNGVTYSQSFDLGVMGDNYHYIHCP